MDNDALEKSHQYYKKLWSGNMKFNFLNSAVQIKLTPENFIRHIKIDENVYIGAEQNPIFQSRYQHDFMLEKRVQPQHMQPESCRNLNLSEFVQQMQLQSLPFNYVTDEYRARKKRRAALKNVNIEAILNILKNAPTDAQKESHALIKLTETLQAYPEKLPEVAGLLHTHRDHPMFIRYLIAAVAASNTDEAQLTLINITKQFKNDPLVMEAVIKNSHKLGIPSNGSIQNLINIYNSSQEKRIRTVSLLALGAFAQKVDKNKPLEKPRTVTPFLVEELQAVADDSERSIVLMAIENSQDPYAYPALKNLAFSSNNYLTWGAIQAIRAIDSSQVDQDLTAILKKSKDKRHQSIILRSLVSHNLPYETVHYLVQNYFSFGPDQRLVILNMLNQPQISKDKETSLEIHKFLDELGRDNQAKFTDRELTIIQNMK